MMDKFIADYNRGMLRSTFKSIFMAAIQRRKAYDRAYGISAVARSIGKHKSFLSRAFAGEPNWTLNTISDLATELELEFNIRAINTRTGEVFCDTGLEQVRKVTIPVNPANDAEWHASPTMNIMVRESYG